MHTLSGETLRVHNSHQTRLRSREPKFVPVRECRCPTPNCGLLFFRVRGEVIEILGHDRSLIKMRKPEATEVHCGRCGEWVKVPMENL